MCSADKNTSLRLMSALDVCAWCLRLMSALDVCSWAGVFSAQMLNHKFMSATATDNVCNCNRQCLQLQQAVSATAKDNVCSKIATSGKKVCNYHIGLYWEFVLGVCDFQMFIVVFHFLSCKLKIYNIRLFKIFFLVKSLFFKLIKLEPILENRKVDIRNQETYLEHCYQYFVTSSFNEM